MEVICNRVGTRWPRVHGPYLLDNAGWRVQVDEALVDAHLVVVPGLGTLSARRHTRGDAQRLGGQTHGSLDLELLALGAVEQLGRHCDAAV